MSASAPLPSTRKTPANGAGTTLSDSQSFLQSVLDSSTEYSIIACDLAGRIILWNEGARRIYGYSPEEIVGQELRQLHAPRDVTSGLPDRLKEETLLRGKFEGTITRVRKNGDEFSARVVMTVLRENAGRPIGLLIVSKDITEEEALRRKLVDSEEYNRSLIEANIDAVFTTDPLGTITAANRRAEQLTGLSRHHLVGTPFKTYFIDPGRAEEAVRRVLAEDRVTNYELAIRSVRGETTLVSFNAMTLRGTDGGLKGIFTSARDISEQKALESELRDSQSYNRGLIEASLDALVTVDPDGIITDLNRQMQLLTGASREELVGSRFPECFVEPGRAQEAIDRVLKEGFLTNHELEIRAAGGASRFVSFNASVFKDVDGGVRGIFASARDITDQKRLQEQLRESQLYNRSLIEASPDALVTVDPDGVITDVNEQMVRVTGFPREELVGSPFKNFFDEPARAIAAVRQTFEQGTASNVQLLLLPRQRPPLAVSLNTSVFRGPDGQVKGTIASARDVTEQRALEEKLRETQNYNRGLIEGSADAMVIVDPGLIITDVNEQFVRLSGFQRRQLLRSSLLQYFAEADLAAAGVRKTLAEGIVTNLELTLRSRSGKTTPVSLAATIFRDVEGKVRGVFATARDIREQKQLEARLRDSQSYNRSLIESSVDALFTTDVVGIVSDVNRQMEAMTGLPRELLLGTPLKRYFTEPERAEEAIRQVLQNNRLIDFELALAGKDGTVTPISFNATTFRGADGSLRGIFASVRDVTAQKRLESDLRESQNYNRSLIESSVDSLVAVDSHLTITDVNEQMVKVTGYSREELVGSLFPDYFTDPGRAAGGVRQTLEEGFVTNYELVLRSRHNRLVHVSLNASVFKDVGGGVRGIFASARDITDQKRLQEQLRESQLYNRSLIEASPDALVTVDPELVITDVNEQFVRLAGAPRDQLIGSSFKDYFTDPERAASGVRRTLREGSVSNYELVLTSSAGRRTLVSFNAAVFKDAEGRTVGIFATARDITEQKRTEEKLRESQNYHRGLIEASPDALVTVAPDLVITDLNEQMVRLTGYSRKHLTGLRFPELFTDAQRAGAAVRKALEDGNVTNYELLLRKRNGQRVPVSFNAGTAYDMAGNVRGVLAAARDITEQKRLEAQLRESQNYNRGLVESNSDALMTTDVLGIITDVNREMEVLTGLSRDLLIGTPFKKYFTDPARAEEGIRRVLSENAVADLELTLRTPGGRGIDVSCNATTFRDTEGRLKGIIASARDNTEPKRLREQLEQRNRELEVQNRRVQEANRLKSEFLANMSHELRTPLNSIIGFSEFLLSAEDPTNPEEQREYLQDVLSSGRHLLQLINDVLDLAKVEAGKMELLPESFSSAKAVAEVCSVIKPLVEQKGIELITSVSPEVDSVVLDPLRFKQILYNLLSNAVKFTSPHGRVEIQVAPRDERTLYLRVIDNGIGIAPEDLPRLFREFEQLETGPARHFQGSGLGLSLTRRLVDLHGGQIEVQSELGRGTTFTVTLPRAVPGGEPVGTAPEVAA